MKLSLVTMALVVLVALSFAPQCEAQYEAIIAAVASKVIGLWRNGQMDLLGHRCQFSVRPKVKRFKLYFRGTMSCPGWTHITGYVQTQSQSKVVSRATEDFVRKAFQAKLITQQEAQAWLSG